MNVLVRVVLLLGVELSLDLGRLIKTRIVTMHANMREETKSL